jgi:hypothetical protein
MTKRRQFMAAIVPVAGALVAFPRVGLGEIATLTEDDKMGSAMGFRLKTEKADQAKYPKHTTEQVCAKCVHYGTPAADSARCDLFNKNVPKGGWCSGFTKRP